MKKHMSKKVLAGSMAVVMGASLAGTYGYQNSINAKAEDEDTKELQKAAQEVLGDSTNSDNGETFKEESVYVKKDASGKNLETTVTEWLKNPTKGEIEDTSSLSDIKNVKGDETFTQGSDNSLKWKSEGEDIYYRGTSSEETPVDVNISYKLDGKEISAKDLKGKDGKLEIQIDYENNAKQKVDVDGEEVEMYTPFTMVTALMLPTDEYKNVSIDNGKIISDADKDIVVGMAFPGLQEDLNLKKLDVEIPDSVTITADVKDASVNPTITMASSEILSEFGLDDVDSFDDLEDSVAKLTDASEQLTDGSKAAADGAGTLADGADTLATGVNTLNDKSGDLISGVNDLAAGVNKYTSSVSSLAEGSAKIQAGAGSAAGGATQVKNGILQVLGGFTGDGTPKNPGANALSTGAASYAQATSGSVDTLSTIITNLLAASASQTATASISGEDAAAAAAVDSLIASGYVDAANRDACISAMKSAISGNVTAQANVAAAKAAPSAAEITAAITAAKTNAGTAATYASGLKTTVDTIYAGLTKKDGLVEGATALETGTQDLTKGASELATGAAALNQSSSLLTTGTQKLQDGGSQLSSGVNQLADGANQLASGAGDLAEGNQTLADGMEEFKTSGIDKITELFDGDIKGVTSRISTMSDLGANYKSYAGIKAGMNGSTKFIIETDGID